MKLIKPSAQIIEPTGYTINDIYKSIELAGRCSHKSEDRITEDSAKEFVDRMIKMNHLATCEFGTVYLQFFWPGAVCQYCNQTMPHKLLNRYGDNKYSIVKYHGNDVYVTTNMRVLIENNWLDDLKYLCEPTEYHEKRTCVRFICDRAISHEFVRHRKFSFLQESTRYCNYSNNKFDNELTFIIPCWFQWEEQIIHQGDFEKSGSGSEDSGLYINSLLNAERTYLDLLTQWYEKIPDKRYQSGYKNNPWRPEQARSVLPLALKTELYMCGFAEDWEKFFELRTASNAHPQARELAIPLRDEFIKRHLID